MLINLLLVKAPHNMMPMSLRRKHETYGMERMPPFEITSRAIEALQSTSEAELRKPGPAGLEEMMAEAVSVEISSNQVKLCDYWSSSEQSSSLLQVGEVLGQPDKASPVLSIDLPRLDYLDFGDKFKLESSQLSKCSDHIDSREHREILSSDPETVMSAIKALAPMLLEPKDRVL